MDEDDFNSSDLEVDQVPDRFEDAGAKSIESMLEDAFRSRVETNKDSKKLTFVRGSVKTQYMNALWHNRFLGFRKNVLKIAKEATPTGEHLERFLRNILQNVVPRSRDVPSYRWLQNGLRRLVDSLIFHYKSFYLSKQAISRLASTIHELFNNGLLTKDPAIEKHPAGAVMVRRLSAGMFTDALKNGTINWDVVLAKALSIVMTAATGARTGDLTVATMDEQQLPYLCYKDITLKLAGGDKLENLVAKVLIRNEKGWKLDPSHNRTVNLKALPIAGDNVACPIKLLLIVALRSGNVGATTIDGLLQAAANRRDKKVVWTQPTRSVLCAFSKNGISVLFDKPAGNHQLTNIMTEAAPKGGVLAKLHSHDLRRGLARDAANINTPIKGYATDAVAAVLGHSVGSKKHGVTAGYVGSITEDVWGKRVSENFSTDFDVDAIDEGFVKRRKLKAADIDEMCEKENLDPSKEINRRRVSALHTQRNMDEWSSAARGANSDQATSFSALSERTPSQINSGMDHANMATSGSARTNVASAAVPAAATTSERAAIPIDPQLLADVVSGEDLPDNVEGITAAINMEANYMDALRATKPFGHDELRIDGVDFVRRFSKINVTTHQALAQWGLKSPKSAEIVSSYSGNSRETVSLWQYPCKNAHFGCSYAHAFHPQVRQHELSCKITSAGAFAESIKEKDFPCDRCDSSFDTAARLKSHTDEVHDWQARACTKDGCDPNHVFQVRSDFQKHMEQEHSPYTSSTCLYPGCTSLATFKSAKTYRAHLHKVHKIADRTEKDKYMPGKKGPFQKQRCRIKDCSAPGPYWQPSKLKDHLIVKHDYTHAEADEYVEEHYNDES